MNWTKVGLKVPRLCCDRSLSRGLNWTKVGLKAAEADGDEALAGLFELD